MTKGITLVLLAMAIIICSSYSGRNTKEILNPFDTLLYDKVVAYDYNGSPQKQIVMDGRLFSQPGRNLREKELSKEQVAKLNKSLGDPGSYGGSTAACFDPHFGVVFYRQSKIVGHISVCLSCNYLQSSPFIPATESHKTDLCETCYAYGFSKKGRKKISAIVKELQFSHWELNSELFDQ